MTGAGQEPWLVSDLVTPIVGHLSPSREGTQAPPGPTCRGPVGDKWLPERLVPSPRLVRLPPGPWARRTLIQETLCPPLCPSPSPLFSPLESGRRAATASLSELVSPACSGRRGSPDRRQAEVGGLTHTVQTPVQRALPDGSF